MLCTSSLQHPHTSSLGPPCIRVICAGPTRATYFFSRCRRPLLRVTVSIGRNFVCHAPSCSLSLSLSLSLRHFSPPLALVLCLPFSCASSSKGIKGKMPPDYYCCFFVFWYLYFPPPFLLVRNTNILFNFYFLLHIFLGSVNLLYIPYLPHTLLLSFFVLFPLPFPPSSPPPLPSLLPPHSKRRRHKTTHPSLLLPRIDPFVFAVPTHPLGGTSMQRKGAGKRREIGGDIGVQQEGKWEKKGMCGGRGVCVRAWVCWGKGGGCVGKMKPPTLPLPTSNPQQKKMNKGGELTYFDEHLHYPTLFTKRKRLGTRERLKKEEKKYGTRHNNTTRAFACVGFFSFFFFFAFFPTFPFLFFFHPNKHTYTHCVTPPTHPHPPPRLSFHACAHSCSFAVCPVLEFCPKQPKMKKKRKITTATTIQKKGPLTHISCVGHTTHCGPKKTPTPPPFSTTPTQVETQYTRVNIKIYCPEDITRLLVPPYPHPQAPNPSNKPTPPPHNHSI